MGHLCQRIQCKMLIALLENIGFSYSHPHTLIHSPVARSGRCFLSLASFPNCKICPVESELCAAAPALKISGLLTADYHLQMTSYMHFIF